jgi:hypothetical protein
VRDLLRRRRVVRPDLARERPHARVLPLKAASVRADEGTVSTTPYPDQLGMLSLGAVCAFVVGVWRGLIYDFSPATWTVAVACGVAGFAVARIVKNRRRETMLLLVPFAVEVFRKKLDLSPELTASVWLFSGGTFLGAFYRTARAALRRRREVRRRLNGALADPQLRGQLDAYFGETGRLQGRLDPPKRALVRAFRLRSRRPRAFANALRSFEAAVGSYLDESRAIPVPPCIAEAVRANDDAAVAMRQECLRVAESVESGSRADLAALYAANRRAVEAGREVQYALGTLARAHRVDVPRWFLKLNCQLAKAG